MMGNDAAIGNPGLEFLPEIVGGGGGPERSDCRNRVEGNNFTEGVFMISATGASKELSNRRDFRMVKWIELWDAEAQGLRHCQQGAGF